MGGTILLASWGDPSYWSETTYVLDDIIERSRTSLRAVARKHPGAKALILVQETLLAPRNPGKLRETLSEAGIDRNPPLASEARDEGGYRGLLEELKLSIQGLAESWLDGVVDEVSVGVTPGVGDFPVGPGSGGGRVAWSLAPGTVNPFSYYASTALLHIIREMPETGPVTLIVDLSHGINYTVAALHRAALAAARIYSVATHSTVHVVFYNSEPWTQGVSELRIWRIREETVHPRSAASRLVYMMLAHRDPGIVTSIDKALKAGGEGKRLKGEIARELALYRKRLDRLAEPAILAAASVLGGFPLLLLQAGLEASKAGVDWETFRMTAEAMLRNLPVVHVSRDDERVTVRHLIGLSFESTKSILALMALAAHALEVYKRLESDMYVEECGGADSARAAAPIATLKRIVEGFLATPLRNLAWHEISQIEMREKLAAKREESGHEDKEDLYQRIALAAREERDYPVTTGKAAFVDKRVFSAHAGLNSNIIDVLYRRGTVMVAYNCQALQGVLIASQSILQDLKHSTFEATT